MRVFIGMIFGALLTITAAFVHDTWATGPSATDGSGTLTQRNMVNWEIVDDNWRSVREHARQAWTTLSHKISS